LDRKAIVEYLKIVATVFAIVGGVLGLVTFVSSVREANRISGEAADRAKVQSDLDWARTAVYGVIREAGLEGVEIRDLRTKYQSLPIALAKEVSPIVRSNDGLDRILLDLVAANAVAQNMAGRYAVVRTADAGPKRQEWDAAFETLLTILKTEPDRYTMDQLIGKALADLTKRGFKVKELDVRQSLQFAPFGVCMKNGLPGATVHLCA
jgi:hypothetical protein